MSRGTNGFVSEMVGHRHRGAATSCPGEMLARLLEDGALAEEAERLTASAAWQ